MGNRRSVKVLNELTREEALQALRDHAEASAKLGKINAQVESSIQRVRDKYASEQDSLKTTISETMKKVQKWAQDNREEEFGNKKSKDWGVGLIGFRTSTPSVKFDRGFKDKALGLLKELKLTAFIRIKEEVDRDKILESREDPEIMQKLNTCGLKVVQDERFYIDLKEESE